MATQEGYSNTVDFEPDPPALRAFLRSFGIYTRVNYFPSVVVTIGSADEGLDHYWREYVFFYPEGFVRDDFMHLARVRLFYSGNTELRNKVR